MADFINSSTYEFSEEKCFYYAVLSKLLSLKRKGTTTISAIEIHEAISKPYFPITLGVVNEVLSEFYEYSILGRWEYENGEIKYDLSF